MPSSSPTPTLNNLMAFRIRGGNTSGGRSWSSILVADNRVGSGSQRRVHRWLEQQRRPDQVRQYEEQFARRFPAQVRAPVRSSAGVSPAVQSASRAKPVVMM